MISKGSPRAGPVAQSAAAPSRATPGGPVSKEDVGPAVAGRASKQPRVRSHPTEFHLTRAGSKVFDARKLKGIVVKRERPEHEYPEEAGESEEAREAEEAA